MTNLRNTIRNKININTNKNPEVTREIKEEEDEKTVDFLVFVVHGVGEAKRHYKKVRQFEEYAKDYIKAEYGDQYSVHFIAIRWHDELHDLDTVDKRLNAVTLSSCPTIRNMTSNFMGDALFYFTSYHGQVIISAVVELMNNAYNEYISKHSDFNGKIILFGHSLGGVILYDILTNQDWKKLEKLKSSSSNTSCSNTEEIFLTNDYSNISNSSNDITQTFNNIDDHDNDNDSFDSINLSDRQIERRLYMGNHEVAFPSINFYPEFFYVCGSSISAALIMRGQYYQDYHLPEHMVFQNIYNRTDPFAYRYEPMVDQDFQNVKPILIKNININITSPSTASSSENDNLGSNATTTNNNNNTSLFVSLKEKFTNKINNHAENPVNFKGNTIESRSLSIKNNNNDNTNTNTTNNNTNNKIVINTTLTSTSTTAVNTSNNSPVSPKLNYNNKPDFTPLIDLLDDTTAAPSKSSHSFEMDTENSSSSYPTQPIFSPKDDSQRSATAGISISDERSSEAQKSDDKRNFPESYILSDNEIAQSNEKTNRINHYYYHHFTTSPPESPFISPYGPQDLLLPSSSTDSNMDIIDSPSSFATQPSTEQQQDHSKMTYSSPKKSFSVPAQSITNTNTNANTNTAPPSKKSSISKNDGFFNKVTRFFSTSSNHGHKMQSNSSESIHSSHSSSSSPTQITNTRPVNEPISQESDTSILSNTEPTSETSNPTDSKVYRPVQRNRTKGFMTSTPDSPTKSPKKSTSNTSSESKPSSGSIECTNIPLPDGRIAIENHPLLKYRIDYMLQENISDVIKGSYVTALSAHTAYWQNRFLIYHIMKSVITKTEYDRSQSSLITLNSPSSNLPSPLI